MVVVHKLSLIFSSKDLGSGSFKGIDFLVGEQLIDSLEIDSAEKRMTTQQLHLFNVLGLVILVIVAVITRATARRIAGAISGGAAAGVAALGIIGLGERAGWWHMAITWEPSLLNVLWLVFCFSAL